MIYLAGDTHSTYDSKKLSIEEFPIQEHMTKDDYVIILGDFGYIWTGSLKEQRLLDELNDKNFTTLFIDGNHECFPLINKYPVTQWKSGSIHKVRDSIFHLMRGQIFDIEDNKIFVMGGAVSYDKGWRTPHVSWWEEELPSNEELETGLVNLKEHDYKVDYILSHCGRFEVEEELYKDVESNTLTRYFSILHKLIDFKKHYFGHYHEDRDFGEKSTCLYNTLIKLDRGDIDD